MGISDQTFKLASPKLYGALWILVAVVFYLAVFPSLYLLAWSVAGTETVGVLNVRNSSLQWFVRVLSDPEWQASILYSCLVATATSVVGCIVLLIHFYSMRYAQKLFERLSYISILLIVLIPAVNYALALRAVGGRLSLSESLTLTFGHLITILPLQFFILESRQEAIASNLLYAGNTLGASHAKNLIFVYLPLMKEALVYAFAVGFFISFDELVIATFVLDSPLITVPRRLWSQVDRSMDPSPAVISCLLLLSTLLLVTISQLSKLVLRLIHSLRT